MRMHVCIHTFVMSTYALKVIVPSRIKTGYHPFVGHMLSVLEPLALPTHIEDK